VVIVEVVVDHNFPFVGVRPMQPTGILNEAAFERKRHSKKEGVQARQVESFADQRGRGEKDVALPLCRSLVDLGANYPSLLYAGATFQTKHCYVFDSAEPRKCLLEFVQMRFAVGQNQRATSHFDSGPHVVSDLLDPSSVIDQRLPNFVDCRFRRAFGRQVKRASSNVYCAQNSFARRNVDRVADGTALQMEQSFQSVLSLRRCGEPHNPATRTRLE
jgi:hypothetical protein